MQGDEAVHDHTDADAAIRQGERQQWHEHLGKMDEGREHLKTYGGRLK